MIVNGFLPRCHDLLQPSGSRIRSWLGIILFLSCCHFAIAQPERQLEKDSLSRELNRMPADTNKVFAFFKLAEYYENSQPDSASSYYERGRLLSAKLSFPAGFVKYATNYSALLSTQGKFQQSLVLLRQAEDTCSFHHLEKQLVAVWGSFGVTYQLMEDYENAISYYLRILPLWEKQDEKHQLGAVYGNLAGLYYHLHQYDKAYHYGRLVLAYEEQYKDPFNIAAACINLGMALKQLDSIPESRRYQQRAYGIGLRLGNLTLQEAALINLGNTYDKERETDSYLPIYQKTLKIARSLGDVVAENESLLAISEGLFWKKKYREAEAILDTAIHFARRNEQREVASNMLLMMSDIQIALGRMYRLQGYRQQYEALRDSITDETRTRNIQELETKYEVGKKQVEILQKNLLLTQKDKEAGKQKQWLTLTSSSLMVLALLLFMGFRTYQQKQELHTKTLYALKAEQEALQLKAKLEGEEVERRRISQEMHDDMGSGLTLLLFLSRSMPLQNGISLKINQTADHLLKKMNEIIWAMNTDENTLESLLAYIRTHMAEMLDNVGVGYSFNMEHTERCTPISQELRRNVYLVVKEAVHNIIKHAEASRVTITVLTGKYLEIDICDNGKGLEQQEGYRLGNGLKNMQDRISKINGKLKFEVREGTRVVLSVPLIM